MEVFPLPKHSYRKTSGYRTPARPGHNGVDYGAPEETPLYAVIDGTVTVPSPEIYGAGNNLWLSSDDGKVLWKYFHCSHIVAAPGQHVRAGDVIAAVGHTGHVEPPGAAGAHLHIERHKGGPSNPTDPTPELDAAENAERWADEYPAPEPEDEPMTPEDRSWIEDQLVSHGNDVRQLVDEARADNDRNVLTAVSNMAKVNHHYAQALARRLGVPPLPDFTVNVEEQQDPYDLSEQPAWGQTQYVDNAVVDTPDNLPDQGDQGDERAYTQALDNETEEETTP